MPLNAGICHALRGYEKGRSKGLPFFVPVCYLSPKPPLTFGLPPSHLGKVCKHPLPSVWRRFCKGGFICRLWYPFNPRGARTLDAPPFQGGWEGVNKRAHDCVSASSAVEPLRGGYRKGKMKVFPFFAHCTILVGYKKKSNGFSPLDFLFLYAYRAKSPTAPPCSAASIVSFLIVSRFKRALVIQPPTRRVCLTIFLDTPSFVITSLLGLLKHQARSSGCSTRKGDIQPLSLVPMRPLSRYRYSDLPTYRLPGRSWSKR